MDDAPAFMLKAMMPVSEDSSILRSSSKYLNDSELRDWVATIILRKNGPDFAPEREMGLLVPILARLRDDARVEEMITEERRTNPQLDAWMSEGFISTYKIEDFKDYPADTVGGRFYEYIYGNGYPLQLMSWTPPKTQLEFYNLRSGQTHDFEHILCGGGFNYMGELVPYWYRLTNVFKFIKNQELAGELSVIQMLGSLRYTVRTLLHYPQIWQTCVETIQRGMRVGQESDALFMARMETVFDLPIDEARKRLGVRGVVDVDTHQAGEIYAGRAVA
jgi:ubiquinone biosynthesis protein COQ4